MNLAIFDLDGTLVNFDCDIDWIYFLISKQIIKEEDIIPQLKIFHQDYKNGTLDYPKFIRTTFNLVSKIPLKELEELRAEWFDKIKDKIENKAKQLVDKHTSCDNTITILATASNAFLTKKVAQFFGIHNLIATIPERKSCGSFTGDFIDSPSFAQGKITRINNWIISQGFHINSFKEIHCYSDSINDLPLLNFATHPNVVNGDEKLIDIAKTKNWNIINIF